jgi:hypothetical protein
LLHFVAAAAHGFEHLAYLGVLLQKAWCRCPAAMRLRRLPLMMEANEGIEAFSC